MKRLMLFFLLVLGTLQAVAQEKKLALIVGNSTYVDGAALRNPANDARAMDKALQALGFETIIAENLSLSQFKKAIDDFGMRLHGYDVGLFYYAGHGIQFKGRNYLIPIDADLKIAQQVEYDCVAADRVLAFMESAKASVNLLILDACRNNPFERSWSRSTDGNGLAFMNAPSGSMIAYATSPGNVASDGEGENGMYTSMLLKHISTPNLTVEQVFKRVRIEVEERTSKGQTPWESTSLKGDFYFLKGATTPSDDSLNVDAVNGSGAQTRDLDKVKSMRGRVKLLAEAPVQFGVGFEASLTNRFSLSLQIGLLRDPNSTLMMKSFEAFGMDEEIVVMIENSFKRGVVLEAGLNYNFRKSYVGVFYQQINLRGGSSPAYVYQSQFDTDINTLPVKPNSTTQIETSLTIQSNLSQLGFLYGRRFMLKNPRFEIDVEAGISKNVGSVTKVTSENREVGTLDNEVNKELDDYYSQYAYIPSLTVAFVYNISR
jgi:uncharacterized caspase-like protein